MYNQPDQLPSNMFKGISTVYRSPMYEPSFFATIAPTLSAYSGMLGVMFKHYFTAVRGNYTDLKWICASESIWRNLERVGCQVHIEGLDNLTACPDACVFASNHMSTLDAFGLPACIRPFKRFTFVVKRELMTMPLFAPIIQSRNAIPVERQNPRADFTTIMQEGKKRLENGVSVLIFPQSTRSLIFDPSKFNSIAVKLAKHAQAPIIPIALNTLAWGAGRKPLKDFGRISPNKRIHIRFGKPIYVHGSGKEEQAALCAFISNALAEWDHK